MKIVSRSNRKRKPQGQDAFTDFLILSQKVPFKVQRKLTEHENAPGIS